MPIFIGIQIGISQSGRCVMMATHDYTHMKKLNDVEKPLANFLASGVLALNDVSLDVRTGEFICIVGPSRPPAPPVPSVKREASIFTQITRRRTIPSR